MTEFDIVLAEIWIHIESLHEAAKDFCRDYIIKEKEDGQEPLVIIKITESDIALERQKSEAADVKEGVEVRYFCDEYLELLAVYRKITEALLDYDVILLHGSAIAVDGEAYLFTAKSGTGKSTHTRLWREYFGDRAVMVNDDKPLVHIAEDTVTVYGTPWDGKHRLSRNIAVPLKGICVLSRAETNHIEPVSGRAIYPILLQQTYRSAEPARMVKSLQLLDKLIEGTNLYTLGCNMEAEAARISFEGMRQDK